MELELGIIREPVASEPKQRLRVFSESGGSIGRSPDNYWVLPDPKCYLSAHHCEIFVSEGAFCVRDTSRNGVFLNRSEKPLGYGRSRRLNDGDEMALATYMVRVRIRSRASRVSPSIGTPAPAEVDYERSVSPSQLPEPGACDDHKGSRIEPDSAPTLAASGTDGHPLSVASSQPTVKMEDTAEHENLSASVESGPTVITATQALDAAQVSSAIQRIVHVDRVSLRSKGHLPPDSMERLIANQFRHIKRPLIKNALGKGVEPVTHGHLVMVTSSLPGEGKTFSSINLALSLARERDLEVVLIDADVAKRDVSRIFGVDEEPGLLNALVDDLSDVESLILKTDIKGFSLLPAGFGLELDEASELLSSSRMEELASQIGARYVHRIALFDSPPLLLTNESRVLGSLMGQIVLIVKSGATPKAAVQQAIGFLDEDKPIGLILNQSAATADGSYHGYGYYSYGSYGAYGDKESEADARGRHDRDTLSDT